MHNFMKLAVFIVPSSSLLLVFEPVNIYLKMDILMSYKYVLNM